MRLCIVVVFSTLAWGQDPLLPLLKQHCGGCHTGIQAQGGLSMDSIDALRKGGKHGPALRPGAGAQSLLVQHMTGEKTPRMPLGSPSAAGAVEAVTAAINAMPMTPTVAKNDAHFEWLLRVPTAVPAAPTKRAGWIKNPIDGFVLANLEQQGMTPAAEATRRTLLRRISFDLIGVPPTPEETRAFQTDPDPQAYDKAVDRLLADPRYGERWGRHWLDLVRYAESDGFAIDGERPTAWRYRDYVIRALNGDKPYNVFVQEQIAGDEFRGKKPAGAGDR